MTTLEITLILVGIVFLIGSFMVKDKLSKNDLDKIADMSAEELKVITEKEVKNAESAIDGMLNEHIASKTDETKRDLEKETNSKIMAINEYSDTVLDSINKSHNEIMFLYSMLNDKHEELTRLSGNIEKITAQAKKTFEPIDASKINNLSNKTVSSAKPVGHAAPVPNRQAVTESRGIASSDTVTGTKNTASVKIQNVSAQNMMSQNMSTQNIMSQNTVVRNNAASNTAVLNAAVPNMAAQNTVTQNAAASNMPTRNMPAQNMTASNAAMPSQNLSNTDVQSSRVYDISEINHNPQILRLYKSGKDIVEIAKELGLGKGEVKLVIDLYNEGK
ncbi:MAG: DUF6115 domain-containing protein [Agathobacter sp.]|uniref:DUF6115 domain-containing protein n=1 Tax=Agathobacter sp. TaxID=2021311 RepID=UPI002E784DB4|nr:DUF6115 domain-containing protein [Agathobacter sp.]MEE1216475.1 DUF6115 domain-containing protein [Agathobacter sp.]